MAQEEQVLVVERAALDEVGTFQGLQFEVQAYLDALLAPGVPRYMPRSLAENDPTFKQLIPYVILSCDGRYVSYVRGKRAGETRLVGHRSIGIGGHINPPDEMPLFDTGFRNAYDAAVQREVNEEIAVEAGHTDRIVALLNDDSTPVGQVHLGIVHLWVLDAPRVAKREQMITQMEFLTPAELMNVRDSMETWSQFCLDNLAEITRRSS